MQQAAWRSRTLLWLLDRLPEADHETAQELVAASILQAETDGFDECRRLIRDIAAGAPANQTAQVIARAADDLRSRNYGPPLATSKEKP
jgi:hypothetical protein